MLEDERQAEEAKGGTETSLVLTNDGTGVQDIGLLTELLEVIDSSLVRVRVRVSWLGLGLANPNPNPNTNQVIDSSLPLIGKANAAKL